MGRPLKIQKYSTGSGDTTTNGVAVAIDQGYPPFAAPTSMDTATVVYPQPQTTVPFTGVVGGLRGGAVSASYPVVEVQVNIALAAGGSAGAHNGAIIRQKGARKFMVVDYTVIQDENVVVGNAYMIASAGGTDWTQWGAPVGWQIGTIFTCTGQGTLANGTAYLVGTCVLYSTTPTAGNMAITMSIANSTPTYISKLTNRFVQDFNGGETGGNASTGDVWAGSQVQNNIDYAANFFADGEQFAKSGADVATWAGTNQNSNGTLTLAEVENYTS
jgi:hypothetical protein